MVRYQYWQHVEGKAPFDPDRDLWVVHVEHCFEYLRQSISCGGDLVIEGKTPLFGASSRKASTVTGWGFEHDCINFERLRDFQIEQERQYNLTWQNKV